MLAGQSHYMLLKKIIVVQVQLSAFPPLSPRHVDVLINMQGMVIPVAPHLSSASNNYVTSDISLSPASFPVELRITSCED